MLSGCGNMAWPWRFARIEIDRSQPTRPIGDQHVLAGKDRGGKPLTDRISPAKIAGPRVDAKQLVAMDVHQKFVATGPIVDRHRVQCVIHADVPAPE